MQRSLRILAVSAVTVALFAAPSFAIDFKGGTWGFGAPIVFSDGTEIALMNVRSSTTVWGLDASYFQNQTRADSSAVSNYALFNSSNLAVGPRWRRYARAEGDFAPYMDVFLHYIQVLQQQTNGPNTIDTHGSGVEGGLSLGAEYITRWHMSVAIHSNLLTSRYIKLKEHIKGTGDGDRTQWSNTIGIQPFIYVRAYW